MNEVRTPVRLRLARLHGVLSAALLFGWAALALPPATVPVPGPLNPADVFGHGAVANDYRIGTFEVTNAQYTEFLNAVADTDTYGLYNPAMTITRTGSAGAYQYATATPSLPVTQVNWYDALRFVNWLHNGQPTGAQNATTTEDGAYTLTGATTAGPRHAEARAWLPSEDEWYKAAYFSDSGATAVYWEYPTGSMTEPVASVPTANPSSANYNGIVGGVAPVGSYPGSAGPYGTFDQAGNVWEWTDTVDEAERVIRGGSWKDYSLLLQAAYRDSELPTLESAFIGFRAALAAEDGGTPPVNSAPVAVADAYSVNRDAVLAVSAPGVLGNDTDADGDPLTAAVVTGPAHGALTLNANGSLSYTPAAGYVGGDAFTYRANDGTANSPAATVTLTVNAVNHAPVAVADAYSVNQNTALGVSAPGVLGNDTDADGNPLTAAVVTGPAHGALTLNANGSLSYTPAADYVGGDAFTYRANDGTANSPTATVTLTVNAVTVNRAPVAVADAYNANRSTTLTVGAPGLLGNDTDADGNALTAVRVTGPAHGTLTLNANGSFSYRPTTGYVGTDSFTYRANDGTANSATARVTITVRLVRPALSIESATARRDGNAYVVTLALRNTGTGDASGLTVRSATLDRFGARNVPLGNIAAGDSLTSTLRLTAYSFRALSRTASLRLSLAYAGGSVSLSKTISILSGDGGDDDKGDASPSTPTTGGAGTARGR